MEAERQPLFRAPWPVIALLVVILGAYAMQAWLGTEAVGDALGFSAAGLAKGRLAPLVVSLFLHGGWAHVLVNSAFILAFGAPVARRCGLDVGGAAAFIGFFLVCGVLGNLTFAMVHPGNGEIVVGASGAAAGLMAAASRLMTQDTDLAPLTSRPVVSMASAWLGVNLLLALLQTLGVVGLAPGSGTAMVAWEVHLGGYAAGLFLFAPMLRLIGRR